MSSSSRRVAVDFDGTLVPRSGPGSQGPVHSDPLPGALEALSLLGRYFTVFILTAHDPLTAVVDWLEDHGIKASYRNELPEFWSQRGILLVTNIKLPAAAYIDDRGLRFESWSQVMADIPAIMQQESDMQAASRRRTYG